MISSIFCNNSSLVCFRALMHSLAGRSQIRQRRGGRPASLRLTGAVAEPSERITSMSMRRPNGWPSSILQQAFFTARTGPSTRKNPSNPVSRSKVSSLTGENAFRMASTPSRAILRDLQSLFTGPGSMTVRHTNVKDGCAAIQSAWRTTRSSLLWRSCSNVTGKPSPRCS